MRTNRWLRGLSIFRTLTAILIILPLVMSVGGTTTSVKSANLAPATRTAPGSVSPARVSAAYGKLPLYFEANQGQTDQRVKFVSRSPGLTLFLTSAEAVLVLSKSEHIAAGKPERRENGTGTVLRMTFLGANSQPRVTGREKLRGRVNYFIGNDPTKWRTNVPTYARVHYKDIYPGVDLVYYGNQRQLEYDFVVAPGVDPGTITLGFKGADRLEVDVLGDLVLHTAAGAIRQRKPLIYQEVGSVRREIPGGYVLKGAHQVGFQVAAYDNSRPLVIDPMLAYSTYLGGNSDDFGFGIAVDAAGNAYVAGATNSTNFPTAGTFQPAPAGSQDAFVTKMNPTGTGLVYSTYLGGNGSDAGLAVAVDAAGNAYLTGITTSANFPTSGAFQPAIGGGEDAFVTKLSPTGSALVCSSYLGGNSNDFAHGIAVDTAGNAYVVGQSLSSNFPATSGAFQTTNAGNGDNFVTKVNPTGTGLVYSTYLGGSGDDSVQGHNIAVDAAGNAYVTGTTHSTDFPTTPGAFQITNAGSADAFVTKVNPTGTELVYSTYLGGSGFELSLGIAVDAAGNAYVTGYGSSPDFPTTPGAFQTANAGGDDAFVTKVSPAGTGLVYSTYLGGSSDDNTNDIAVDAAGNAYVTGQTQSADFPTTPGAFQPAFGGVADAFMTKVNPTGTNLAYSTYLGGSGEDDGFAIALDAAGNVYVAGFTRSANYPTTPGVFQLTFAGGASDAIVAKLNLTLIVTIDIKPGDFPNPVPDTDPLNLSAQGKVPVGIFTTPSFDAATVDASTVRFVGAPPVMSSLQDVDGDSDLDLVLQFNTQDLNLSCGDTQAILTGQTTSGNPIKGTDSIRVLKNKSGQKCP